MEEDKVSLLERKLERERRTRLELEREIESHMSDLYRAYAYQQQTFDAVGVNVLHLNANGELLKANRFAMENLLGAGTDSKFILERFKVNHSNITMGDLILMLDKEIEIAYEHGDGQLLPMVARLTSFKTDSGTMEYLLTMKDIKAIRANDIEVQELQSQLVESAYRDGVAENAVSVLHNIGNILTAIIGKLSDESILRDLSLTATVLGKLSAVVGDFKTPEEFSNFVLQDPKAHAIPKLIRELARSTANSEAAILETFSSIKVKSSDIAEVIAAQQNYANFRDKTRSDISARKIVSDCLMMHKERIASRRIEVVVDEFPIASVYMEKIGLAQTLSNSIMNAIEAIDERFTKDPGYDHKTIRISGTAEGQFLVIKISDNGIGVPPEVASQLFRYGFSTKNRSSGFGLHNCANFMNSNSGKMEILSPGLNQGATSVLYCPMREEASREISA